MSHVYSAVALCSTLLLSGCSLLANSTNDAKQAPLQRVQGTLEQQADGNWQLTQCWTPQTLQLSATDLNKLSQAAPEEILRSGSFIDSSGSVADNQQFIPQTLHRLQAEGHACEDQKFKQLFFRASGNEPGWLVSIEKNGLLFAQFDQPAIALPFIETTLPSGAISFSSSDPTINFQLMLSPKTCIDSMSGTTSRWQAQVQFGESNQRLQGCAYPGLQRQ